MYGNQNKAAAQQEIRKTVYYCNVFSRTVGIRLVDDFPVSSWKRIKDWILLSMASVLLLLLLVGEAFYLSGLLLKSAGVAEFITSLHIVGYGSISGGKMVMFWYKKDMFRQLVQNLADIWPVDVADRESREIKKRSLQGLERFNLWYSVLNQCGVMVYNVTPLALHAARLLSGQRSDVGYVWHVAYPFDKHEPFYHAVAYLFEACSGQASVWFMLSSDLLFISMTSHITMLLRLLLQRVRRLAENEDINNTNPEDYNSDIVSCVKVHQQLIIYFKELEEAFSIVNLINVLLSAVNICCVVFVIALLEPWTSMSNKLFLVAALIQTGVLCWYAEDLSAVSAEIADAVYHSGWYKMNTKNRRLLLILLQRSQKPLYFTTMKFNKINLSTYTSIMKTAYSYFTLLYTMYEEK